MLEKLDGPEKYDPEMVQSLDSFLWKLALWTSKGRLPINANLYTRFYLTRWPNMARLLLTPHSMRVAALMVSGPRTLLNIAEVLGIRQQYVFAFFSATMALGIVEKVVRQRKAQSEDVPAELVPRHHSSFLGGILRRLRQG